MSGAFDPEALRAFRSRDWMAVREAKEQFWVEQQLRQGPLAALVMSAGLWEHARALDPTWPGAEQRAEDLAHHVELAERIRRVAHVFAGR
ncbi:hypothetical protein [Paraliomyxa miuraensis]|uniref:hypothetical protein n=1 Tax=Paraliomyxa miuraensis TaxID=376150 RepID=UPI00225AD981|nr:hypothetical protein [Paraliomyxa miuraensis]MCX4247416.1 hypothetical protein [Paraliomyxa miuraensis]